MTKKSNIRKFLKVLLIVLVIAFIIITVGIFINSNKTSSISEMNDQVPCDTDGDKQNIDKEKLKSKLRELEFRISELETKREKDIETVRKYTIRGRLLVSIVLIVLNLIYYRNFNDPFQLSKQCDLNEATILSYSFIAFMIYGTPQKFIEQMGVKIKYVLFKSHFITIDELDNLKKDRDNILKQL